MLLGIMSQCGQCGRVITPALWISLTNPALCAAYCPDLLRLPGATRLQSGCWHAFYQDLSGPRVHAATICGTPYLFAGASIGLLRVSINAATHSVLRLYPGSHALTTAMFACLICVACMSAWVRRWQREAQGLQRVAG